jgi:hypothetical protein
VKLPPKILDGSSELEDPKSFASSNEDPGAARESIVDIQETDTYTPPNRRSTDLLAGVVQHPES